ncbi:NUDIX domain-containing protein [Patescibacteria group bacterium]|nr:NUDIX domain-containing protein [Patescibacteria group bacterium]
MRKAAHEGDKHFTVSVWMVTDGASKKILLIHHKKLGTWMQPGGHIESWENPVEAAAREAKEETGLDIRSLLPRLEQIDAVASYLPLPDFFMEQAIPRVGTEPAHFHLDLNYRVALPEQMVRHAPGEAEGIGWFTKDEALRLRMFENTKRVIRSIL